MVSSLAVLLLRMHSWFITPATSNITNPIVTASTPIGSWGSVYRNIKYDGSLFCNLICDDNPTMDEKYPPGTRVERLEPSTNMLLAGTVMDIPFPDDLSLDTAPSYTIQFNNGTSMSIPLSEMADIIPKPPVDIATSNSQDSLLPPFLCLNSKITYENNRTYRKG
jgi:hypothetical protein